MAFASAVSLNVHSSKRAVCSSMLRRTAAAPVLLPVLLPVPLPAVRAQQEREVAPENDELQRELRGRVKELFGDVSNVQISTAGDEAEFTVRQNLDPEYGQAVFTVKSIALLSVAIGILFSFMYLTGAVHGSPSPGTEDSDRMSGSITRYDPYELLQSASRYDEDL